eukprot:1617433-Pleurochrysis_carterae.AAC.1
MLKKHGYPPLRAFRVVEVLSEYNALRVDTRGTGIQPTVVKVTSRANGHRKIGGSSTILH